MSETLLTTPFYSMHLEAGAKMVPFAGFDMPVQYAMGVKQEHLHCRAAAGLFDVSHMGQVSITGPSMEAVALALESLIPADYLNLAAGRQRYGFFTNDKGGILDDLMVTNAGDHFFVIVNAACKAQDIAHMQSHFGDDIKLDVLDDRALLALQGPKAAEVLARLAPEVMDMRFMDARPVAILGHPCFIGRAGYTGEDGFEISVANDRAEALASALLAFDEVEWIGLGARDSLRLEAGLCLYGHDLNTDTTPVSANLVWGMQKSRRAGGDRAAGFPGADIVLAEIANGPAQRRVGLLPEGKAPVREGASLVLADGSVIGTVTSGGFGPSLGAPLAMGYVDSEHAVVDAQVFALVRGKQLPCRVCKMPFVEQTYHR
ncbi:MAG TPA: glycine cleavage system aminomethyltransferase GcvT [Oceanospirillaceae bacterium]|nr:glycine cleavage system aminomethyltransferase GcvT [Oceanospirillaceae bacterium]